MRIHLSHSSVSACGRRVLSDDGRGVRLVLHAPPRLSLTGGCLQQQVRTFSFTGVKLSFARKAPSSSSHSSFFFYLKATALSFLGVGMLSSYFIDEKWRTFARVGTDPSVNKAVAARGRGSDGEKEGSSSSSSADLAGYSFTAYNNPPSALEESVVAYPPLPPPHHHPPHHPSHPSVADIPLVDVCIIGGGFAGLHTALALAERQQAKRQEGAEKKKKKMTVTDKEKSIAVLEANRIGSGASGMCGGMAIVGFETELELLTHLVGLDAARELFRQNISNGYDRLARLIQKYKIRCGMVEAGLLEMMLANRFVDQKQQQQQQEQKQHGEEAANSKNAKTPSLLTAGSGRGAVSAELVRKEMAEVAEECAEEEAVFGRVAHVLSKETIEKEGVTAIDATPSSLKSSTSSLSSPTSSNLGHLASDRFAYGCYNTRTFSVNPLALCLGLARACVESGYVTVHERSEVVKVVREPVADSMKRMEREKSRKLSSKSEGGADNGEKEEDEEEWARLEATHARYGAGDFIVETKWGGVLRAKQVLIATNSVPYSLRPSLAMCTTPCSTAIMLTEPFPPSAAAALLPSSSPSDNQTSNPNSSSSSSEAKTILDKFFSFKGCAIDERFGLIYMRRVEGNRVLFGGLAQGTPFCPRGTGPRGGGLEDLRYPTPSTTLDLSSSSSSSSNATPTMRVAASRLMREFALVFPDLAPFLKVQECWEGRIEQRETMFPLVGRVEEQWGREALKRFENKREENTEAINNNSPPQPTAADGLWYAVGFAGHGIVPTCAAGEVLAAAIDSVVYPTATRKQQTESSTNSSNTALLDAVDTRYRLWKEVSLFPSAEFKRAAAAHAKEKEKRQSVANEGKGGGSDQIDRPLSSFIEAPPPSYARSHTTLGSYLPPRGVFPPCGFPLTSVIPSVFIDYVLPFYEWWQGAV